MKVPLGLLALGGGIQGDNTAEPGVQRLGDPFDRAAFAGRIPAFKDNHDAKSLMSNPLLQLDQFDMQLLQFLLVERVLTASRVGGAGTSCFAAACFESLPFVDASGALSFLDTSLV